MVTIDLYRTQAGTYVAHVKYRAGSRLGREMPVDRVYSNAHLPGLFLSQFHHHFIRGWPENGSRDANSKDFTKQHDSVMMHGKQQLREAVAAAMALLNVDTPCEEIV